MRLLRISILWTVAALGCHAVALATTYTIERCDGSTARTRGELVARAVESHDGEMRFPVDIPGSGAIDLPDGQWDIALRAPGLWAAARTGEGDAINLQAWPVGSIAGQVRSPARGAAPRLVRIRFAPARPLPAVDAAVGAVDCAIDGTTWRCELPAGTHDLTIAAAGYAPVLRPGVRIVAGRETGVGTIDLRPGAAVAGRVRVGRGVNVALSDVRVSVVAAGASTLNENALTIRTSVDKRGFFQASGVRPGDYFVSASAPGVTSDVARVRVLAGLLAELNAPLTLGAMRRVRLTLSPPLDPDSAPWVVRLARARPGSPNELDPLEESPSRAGLWSSGPLHDGEYRAEIMPRGGSVWRVVELSVAGEDVEQTVEIPAQRVAGTVMFGDQPLAARLTFGGEFGEVQHELRSDERGNFSGVIPRLEDAESEILVTADSPPVRRAVHVKGRRADDGTLEMDIRLSRTLVSGTVVQEDGTPERYPILTFRADAVRFRQQIIGGVDGSFDVAGLSPGKYRVMAEGFRTQSRVVQLEIDESVPPPPVRIVTRRLLEITGRVMVGAAPVPSAKVFGLLPPGIDAFTIPSASSDAAGAFILSLPPETREIDVLAAPSGLALTMGHVAVRTDTPMLVEIEPQGGSLTVEIPGDAGHATLSHAGATFPLGFLADLGNGTITPAADRQTVTLPIVEPGDYTVCQSGRCASTVVPPLGAGKVGL